MLVRRLESPMELESDKNARLALGLLSLAAAVRGAKHGGRSMLEFQKMNPGEADATQVVFSGS